MGNASVMSDEEVNRHVIPNMKVVLRRRGPGKVWTARFIFDIKTRDHGRTERSTGKADLQEAINAALVRKGALEKEIQDGWKPGSKPTFSEVADEYLAALDRVVNRSGDDKDAGFLGWDGREDSRPRPELLARRSIAINRYLMPQLGHLSIDSIAVEDVEALWRWRWQYHDERPTEQVRYIRRGEVKERILTNRPPAVGTLNKERQALLAVFRFAIRKKYVQKNEVPEVAVIGGGHIRRAAFTPGEMERIQRVSIERIGAEEDPDKQYYRWMLHMRMMWIYLTGCRPQEIGRLQIKDLLFDEEEVGDGAGFRLEAHHCKRMEHKRTVVTVRGFDHIFFRSTQTGRGYDLGDYLFCHRGGRRILKVANSFKRLLRAAGIPEKKVDASPLYSLRHTFITERLSEGWEIGRLARWCGTSVEMIEKFYMKTEVNKEVIAELRARRRAAIGDTSQGNGRPEPASVIVPFPDDLFKELDFRDPALIREERLERRLASKREKDRLKARVKAARTVAVTGEEHDEPFTDDQDCEFVA